jgi:hypothetical protein
MTMTQAYLDESRASDPYALPNLSVQHWEDAVSVDMGGETQYFPDLGDAFDAIGEHWIDGGSDATIERAEGYYVAVCLPGCLPDSDWMGPYGSEEEAIEEARAMFGDES